LAVFIWKDWRRMVIIVISEVTLQGVDVQMT
jgi:hypothetical protein